MSELEILRRRRELVLLSAQLQRATVVRRLDRVNRHPLQAVVSLAAGLASVPLAFKVGTILIGRIGRRHGARPAARGARASLVAAILPALRFLPATALFPVLKFLNR